MKLPLKRHLIPAVMLTAFYTMPLYAIAQTEGLPDLMQQNQITYVTGGIGDDERAALNAAKHDFNLQILNTDDQGAFVGDVHVVINDTKGGELVTSDAGPIFYAKLPVGIYKLAAAHGDETKKQTIRITASGKASTIHFAW